MARPYVVLVATDLSDISRPAVVRALEIANQRPTSVVHAVYVVPGRDSAESGASPDGALHEAGEKLRAFVEPELKSFPTQGKLNVERLVAHVRAGKPAHEIVQLAMDLEADEIVVGTHGRQGIARALLGSVAEVVLRTAPCSVLAVRPKGQATASQPVPAFTPPCPRCVEARETSGGARLWCDQHSEQHGRRHTYHYPASSGAHSSGFLIH
jgi:universal stress protein A